MDDAGAPLNFKGVQMEKVENKHIKKMKPQNLRPSSANLGANGAHPCPPVGG